MRTTIELPDDVHLLLKDIAASRDESMGRTITAILRAVRDGDVVPGRRIERDQRTGRLVAVGGPQRSMEEVRQLAYDE
ncbi:MAG: hypothetical protein R2704_05775 [Microthrixaceae bacterium]